MLEDGTWEQPQRPKKRGEYIPIDEVHGEHVHPDYISGALDPEQHLLEQEEAEREGYEITPRIIEKVGTLPDESVGTTNAIERMEGEDHTLTMRIQDREPASQEELVHEHVHSGDAHELKKEKARTSDWYKPVGVRSAQGNRGKEPAYKNKKGKETVRKPQEELVDKNRFHDELES